MIYDIEMVLHIDDHPDPSYLYQDGLGFEEMRNRYESGEFWFVGVKARAIIVTDEGTRYTIESPGIWGVEYGLQGFDEYVEGIFQEEKTILFDDLQSMGIDISGWEHV